MSSLSGPAARDLVFAEDRAAVDRGADSKRPHVLATGSSRSLLLTVLGALVRPAGVPVWTSALLHVLKGLGLEEQTARQGIARGAAAGWIDGQKHGREVRWVLTETGLEILNEISRRAHSMSEIPKTWDGNCLILMVTIPQARKEARKRLYSALGWAGFGNPAPGLWATPRVDRAGEVEKLIEELGLQGSTFGFVGRTWPAGLSDDEIVRRAWDLDGVAARYEKLIARFENVEPEPGDDVLLTYLALVHEWRRFPFIDPQLPDDLLPDWIGRRATELFVDRRKVWAAAVDVRWQEILALNSPVS